MEAEFPFRCVCLVFFAMLKCETFPLGMLADLTASLVVFFLLCRKRRHQLLCCLQRALWDNLLFFPLENYIFAFYSTDVMQGCV